MFQYTNSLSFGIEAHSIYTIPLIREQCDSFLYYLRYKTLKMFLSQNLFQLNFNPVHGIIIGVFYSTIHPQNITLSIQDVFVTYMDKLIKHQ